VKVFFEGQSEFFQAEALTDQKGIQALDSPEKFIFVGSFEAHLGSSQDEWTSQFGNVGLW
jgi:hypothetical protein